MLGVALAGAGRDIEAEDAYRRAIRTGPNFEEGYYNLGVLMKSDRRAEAQALFREAIEIDPNYAHAHRELGFVLLKDGPHAETEGHLRKAIELEPGDAWAHIYLGNYLWTCSNVGAALAEFRTAQQLAPDWPVSNWTLGDIYECELGDFRTAQFWCERALQIDPEDFNAHKNLGRLCKRRGQFALAREHLGRALALDPDNAQAIELMRQIDESGGEF